MPGERLHIEGWTEISAVCTAPPHRGQGIASRLVRAVVTGIERRSERAFLHTGTTNTTAINLYGALGFRVRRRLTITVISAPHVSGTQSQRHTDRPRCALVTGSRHQADIGGRQLSTPQRGRLANKRIQPQPLRAR